MSTQSSAPDTTQTPVQATVVYEHSDNATKACSTEAEALAWLVEALYLVEDGIIAADTPTPTLRFMENHARSNGWTVTLIAPER